MSTLANNSKFWSYWSQNPFSKALLTGMNCFINVRSSWRTKMDSFSLRNTLFLKKTIQKSLLLLKKSIKWLKILKKITFEYTLLLSPKVRPFVRHHVNDSGRRIDHYIYKVLRVFVSFEHFLKNEKFYYILDAGNGKSEGFNINFGGRRVFASTF